MPSMARRVVDKWLADQIQEQIRSLRTDGMNGAGTIFATLAQVSKLHKNDIKKIEKEFDRRMKRLQKSADLPRRWAEIHAALSKPE